MNELRQTLTPSTSITLPRLMGDFAWVLLGLLLWLIVFFVSENSEFGIFFSPLRIGLGLMIVLYFPGYCLQLGLFPRTGDLDNIERVGLSLGLSIAWVSVLALILHWLPVPLKLEPIVVGMFVSILFFMSTAVTRRNFVSADELYRPTALQPRRWWQNQNGLERRIVWSALVALLLIGGSLAWSLTAVSSQGRLTEFYMLGEEGLAENFPREAAVGEPIGVQVGIQHLEAESQTYRIDIVQNDVWTGQTYLLHSVAIGELAQGELWAEPVNWEMQEGGLDQQVSIYLFIEGQDAPYRELRLWLDVEDN